MAQAEQHANSADLSDEAAAANLDEVGDVGFVRRLRSMDRRALVFVIGSLALLALALTNIYDASNGVEIDREQAIEIARDEVDFEPVNVDARLLRQGFRLDPVWGVSLSIPGQDGNDNVDGFERLATVEIDARTGEVLRIGRDSQEDSEE